VLVDEPVSVDEKVEKLALAIKKWKFD